MKMNREDVALRLLQALLATPPDDLAYSPWGVDKVELAMLAASVIDTCPSCGSITWVNIDCPLCEVGRLLDNLSTDHIKEQSVKDVATGK